MIKCSIEDNVDTSRIDVDGDDVDVDDDDSLNPHVNPNRSIVYIIIIMMIKHCWLYNLLLLGQFRE